MSGQPRTPNAPARRLPELELAAWFHDAARSFPWRPLPLGVAREPYPVLVSETMLQQTQAKRVIDRFNAFMRAFPTEPDLASGETDRVLELWSGLGYYQRARRLQLAAQAIVERGGWPTTAKELRDLPGVGAYTAGAIASLCFGERSSAVDGNVARVLLRFDGVEGRLNHEPTMRAVRRRADAVLRAASEPPAIINEALIELGATVCTPASPGCDACPLASACVARAHDRQAEIPAPRPAPRKTVLYAASVLAFDGHGRVLVEQRPPGGLWGGLWQAATLEGTRPIGPARAARALGLAGRPRVIARFATQTSHRDVRFVVMASSGQPRREGLTAVHLSEVGRLALSSAQQRILCEMAPAHQPPCTPDRPSATEARSAVRSAR